MNQNLIIANWKCNPTSLKETKRIFESVRRGVDNIKNTEVVFCPPFVYLAVLSDFLKNKSKSKKNYFIKLGAQDTYYEEKGAFTGAISPLMLKDLGANYVIVGHSERRKYFYETDEMVNKKIKAALDVGLKPILCVGEETRDSVDSDGQPVNEMGLIVGEQLEKDLAGISNIKINNLIIAYEPIWAIGTGVFCPSDEAMQAGLFIRKILLGLYNRKIAENMKILYGGSVNSKNAADYIKQARLNGLLVGGASLNPAEFVGVIKEAAN